MYDWSNKNVVFIGGFTGVGHQICCMLMQKKVHTLVIVHRMENAEMMKKLQAENPNVKLVFMQMNLMEHLKMVQVMTQIGSMLGHIDVLINGMDVLADKDVETTIGVNLSGMIHMTMLAMPFMDKTQMGHGGMVVNISSVYGLEPAPACAVYAAAKHGVVGFTRSMSDKHICQKTGVMFMCMCPGLTSNEVMMNLRDNVTWMHSEELVDAIESAKHQTPEEAAVQMMKAMDTMKNGSMWLVNHGQLKEVMPMVHWHM